LAVHKINTATDKKYGEHTRCTEWRRELSCTEVARGTASDGVEFVDTAVLQPSFAPGQCLLHPYACGDRKDWVDTSLRTSHVVVGVGHCDKIANAVSNNDGLQVDRHTALSNGHGVRVVDGRCKDREVAPSITFSAQMKSATLKPAKGLEKDGDEGGDVDGSVFGREDRLTMVRVREPDADWFIQQEEVCLGVPRVGIVLRAVAVVDVARTELHECAKRTRTSRPAVDPHKDRVNIRVATALEEVEEEVFGFYVDVA